MNNTLKGMTSFSSCQKNVLLGQRLYRFSFCQRQVSVVVRRMYYWDALKAAGIFDPTGFSSCQKNVLLGQQSEVPRDKRAEVSVVVRRMYYWDLRAPMRGGFRIWFQQLLEECTIGTSSRHLKNLLPRCFSSCQKNVLLGLELLKRCYIRYLFQQLLEECTIGTPS